MVDMHAGDRLARAAGAVLGAGDLAADGVVEDVHPRRAGRRLQDAGALGVVDRADRRLVVEVAQRARPRGPRR